MKLFDSQGYSICNITLEMAKDSLISKGYLEQYVAPENCARMQHSAEAPEGITTLRKAAKHFDVVGIDSYSKIHDAKPEDFDQLRKDFPIYSCFASFQMENLNKPARTHIPV